MGIRKCATDPGGGAAATTTAWAPRDGLGAAAAGPAAAACAALSPEPMPAKSEAAEATNSGTTTTYDITAPCPVVDTSLHRMNMKVPKAYADRDPAFERSGKLFTARGSVSARPLVATCTTTLVIRRLVDFSAQLIADRAEESALR